MCVIITSMCVCVCILNVVYVCIILVLLWNVMISLLFCSYCTSLWACHKFFHRWDIYVTDDISVFDNRAAEEQDEYVLCSLQVNANGVLCIRPDFNRGRKPYIIETMTLGRGRVFCCCFPIEPFLGVFFYTAPSPWYNHSGWLGVKHQVTYTVPCGLY